jgi:hypothetical protein
LFHIFLFSFSPISYQQEDTLGKKVEVERMLRARVVRLTRGLMFCEMHRFHKERLQSITSLLSNMAAVQLQVAHASSNKWKEIVGLLALDDDLDYSCVSRVLASGGGAGGAGGEEGDYGDEAEPSDDEEGGVDSLDF